MKAPFWTLPVAIGLLGLSQPVLAQVDTPRPNPPVEPPAEPEEPLGSAADLLVYDADLSTIELEVPQPRNALILPGQAESPVVSPNQPNPSLIWLPNNEAPSDRLNLSGL
ncbi:hypothetical protein [Trichothermofontia sp.]